MLGKWTWAYMMELCLLNTMVELLRRYFKFWLDKVNFFVHLAKIWQRWVAAVPDVCQLCLGIILSWVVSSRRPWWMRQCEVYIWPIMSQLSVLCGPASCNVIRWPQGVSCAAAVWLITMLSLEINYCPQRHVTFFKVIVTGLLVHAHRLTYFTPACVCWKKFDWKMVIPSLMLLPISRIHQSELSRLVMYGWLYDWWKITWCGS